MEEYTATYGSELKTQVLHFGDAPVENSTGKIANYTFHALNQDHAQSMANEYLSEIKELIMDELDLPVNVTLRSLEVKLNKLIKSEE
jgi:hypothetical protein